MFDYKSASQEQIKIEWARIAVLSNDNTFGTRKELQYLPELLHAKEQVLRFASGLMNNKTWLIVLTDKRVLFLNKGLLTGVEHTSIHINKINSVTGKEGWLFGKIIIADGGSKYIIKNISKTTVKTFVLKLQEQINGPTTYDKVEDAQEVQQEYNYASTMNINTEKKKNQKHYSLAKKIFLTFISIFILLFIVGLIGSNDKTKQKEDSTVPEKTYSTTLESTLKTKVQDDTLTVTITANTPDGAIFEVHVSPLFTSIAPLMSTIVINNQEGFHTFTIPKSWGTCVLYISTKFTFDDPNIVQPDEVQKLYGNAGEKIKSKDYLNKTPLFMSNKTTPYPSVESVKKQNLANLQKSFNALKTTSKNVIQDISFNKDNPGLILVTVSDDWYSAPKHIKERFVEQYTNLIEAGFKRFPVYFGDESNRRGIMVQYLDGYQKIVAEPKIFGGYKILQ